MKRVLRFVKRAAWVVVKALANAIAIPLAIVGWLAWHILKAVAYIVIILIAMLGIAIWFTCMYSKVGIAELWIRISPHSKWATEYLAGWEEDLCD